jgi:ATP-dependent exoDNAse (exonuclease V) beta subunit
VRELLTRIESGDSEAQGAPEQEADGVRLLTTHKAKGLEFDTVIVPDTAADLRGPGGGVLREWPATPDEPLGIWLRSTDEDSLGESQCDLAGYFAKAEADQRGAAEEKRVLYVAYTRARSRIVLVGTVRDMFDKETWADQLLRAVGVHAWGDACADPALELTWHEGVQRGEPQSHAPAIQRARGALAAGVLHLPHASDTSLLAPVGDEADVYVPPEAAEFGTLVHEALERRLRASGAAVGVVGDALKSHVQAAAEALGTLPKARRELPEFGLITPEGAKRLDLLRVLEDGSYEIIDYKTDRVEGDLAEHAEREHGPQLRAYAASLAALLQARGANPKTVRTYVCFTGLDSLHPRQRVVEIALNPTR